MAKLEKRKWCYVQSPAAFEIAPCVCGNTNTQWSEFAKHLWCPVCKLDFMPAHNGIFDGPIPAGTAQMMGISFDRINLETRRLECFDPETGTYGKFRERSVSA